MRHDRSILEMTRVRTTPALVLVVAVVTLAACSSGAVHDDAVARGTPSGPVPSQAHRSPQISTAARVGASVIGFASWYRRGPHLQRTCTGKPLSDDGLLAASPTLPVGTAVRVTLLHDDRSVIVRVDDCMPPGHRAIDLSIEAARQLGLLQRGVALVRITPVAWR
ncbi:MAG: septal ring lytic transglycosylase RlpA family protein [Acetobacteraceae bacterium]